MRRLLLTQVYTSGASIKRTPARNEFMTRLRCKVNSWIVFAFVYVPFLTIVWKDVKDLHHWWEKGTRAT